MELWGSGEVLLPGGAWGPKGIEYVLDGCFPFSGVSTAFFTLVHFLNPGFFHFYTLRS